MCGLRQNEQGGGTVLLRVSRGTPPNGTHDMRAEEETLLFVMSPNGIRIIE